MARIPSNRTPQQPVVPVAPPPVNPTLVPPVAPGLVPQPGGRSSGLTGADDVITAEGLPRPVQTLPPLAPFQIPAGLLRTWLNDNPADPGHHGRIASAIQLTYLRDNDPEAAFKFLQNEFLKNDNLSARLAYQQLKLVHAMRLYQVARDRGDQAGATRALTDVALLEKLLSPNGNPQGSLLDKLPQQDAELAKAAKEQAKREEKLREQQTLGVLMPVLNASSAEGRAAGRDELRRLAKERLDQGDDRLAQAEKTIERLSQLRDLQDLLGKDVGKSQQLLESIAKGDPDPKRAERYQELSQKLSSRDPQEQAVARMQLRDLLQVELEPARFLSPDKFLESLRDPKLVEAARRHAQDAEDQLHKQSQAHFDAALNAKDPAARRAAVEKFTQLRQEGLERLAHDPLQLPYRRLATLDALKSFQETGSPEALAQLVELAREGADEARDALKQAFVKQFQGAAARKPFEARAFMKLAECLPAEQRGPLLQELQSPHAEQQAKGKERLEKLFDRSSATWLKSARENPAELRGLLPDGSDLQSEMVTRRSLRGLKPDSKPEDFQKALAELEKQPANAVTREWKSWVKTHGTLSELENAKDATQRQAAMKKLVELAGTDPVARRALAGILIQQPGDSQPRLESFLAQGLARAGEPAKPVFVPRLPKLDAKELDALQREAAAALVKQPRLEEGELSALAMRVGAHKDLRIEERLRQSLGDPAENKAAQQAVLAALEGDSNALNLADLLLEGPSLGREEQTRLIKAAGSGNTAAMRVGAGMLAMPETTPGRDRMQSTLLALASTPERSQAVLQQMLDKARSVNDKGQLLATLGAAVARSGKDLPEAREVLRKGLKSAFGAASALDGMLAAREFWKKEDVTALTKPLQAEMVRAFRRDPEMLAKIPADVQQEIRTAVIDQLAEAKPEERTEIFRLLEPMAGGLTSADVKRLADLAQDVRYKDLQTDTGRLLLQALARGKDESVKADLARLLLEREWGSLTGPRKPGETTTMQNEFRALVDYAAGRPTDLKLAATLQKQIYDLGLPRPPALIFQDMGLALSDPELVKMGTEANRHHSPQEIRNIAERVELFNNLPPEVRERLAGRREGLDPRQVAHLMANGALAETPLKFLLDPVGKDKSLQTRLDDFRRENDKKLHEISEQLRVTESIHASTLKKHLAHTKEGINWWNRNPGQFIEHTGNFLTGQDRETVQGQFERTQGSRTLYLHDMDEKAAKLRSQLTEPTVLRSSLEVAEQLTSYRRAVLNGDRRRADQIALGLFGTFGEQLESMAPEIWKELKASPGGDGIGNRNLWQRFKQDGGTDYDRMPDPGTDVDRIRDLLVKSHQSGKGDRHALQAMAVSNLLKGHEFNSFLDSMAALGKPMQELQGILSAGLTGTRYPGFVEDARKRADEIARHMESMKTIYGQNKGAIDAKLADLKKVVDALPADHPRRKELANTLKAGENFRAMCTPGTKEAESVEFLVKAVKDGKFDDQSLATWWAKDGAIEVAGMVAGAVAAAVAIALTGGLAAPVVLVIVAGSAAAGTVVATEATKEILYHYDNNHANFKREGSYIGAYNRGTEVVDFEAGKVRPRELGRDVLLPLGKDFGEEFLTNLITAGTGKLMGAALKPLKERLGLAAVQQVEKRVAQELIKKTIGARVKDFFVKFGNEIPKELLVAVKNKLKDSVKKPVTREMWESLKKETGLDGPALETRMAEIILVERMTSSLELAAAAAGGQTESLTEAGLVGDDLKLGYKGDLPTYLKKLRTMGCRTTEESPGVWRVQCFDGREFLVSPATDR